MAKDSNRSGNWKEGYKHQDRAGLDQANPVSGTKYEWKAADGAGSELGTQQNVRIIGIMAICTWTVQPTPLECHITIDGNALTASQTDPVTATEYAVCFSEFHANEIWFSTTYKAGSRGFLAEGKNVKVEFEITGGTVQNLSAYVIWAKK